MAQSQHSDKRKPVFLRLPADHFDVYNSLAEEEGLDTSAWIAKELAYIRGLPVPTIRQKRRRRNTQHDDEGAESTSAA